jgi:hypothetical protein
MQGPSRDQAGIKSENRKRAESGQVRAESGQSRAESGQSRGRVRITSNRSQTLIKSIWHFLQALIKGRNSPKYWSGKSHWLLK